MKPTARFGNELSVLATTPCRGLSLFSLDANARRCRHVIAVRGHRC